MQLRRKLHTPYWRDPAHSPEHGAKKSLLAILSLLAVSMLLIPPAHGGYDEPLSVQLVLHEPAAWICFAFMLTALAYFGKRMWAKEHYAATIACVAMCGCLLAIAATNPFSSAHFFAFSCLVILMGLLHWGLWWTHENAKLFALAVLATGAVGVCFVWLGFGERLLIMASTASLNVVFYEHISY
jgi:hypothetical protein